MKYGKSELIRRTRLPWSLKMIRDLIDSLWRDPVSGAAAESGLGMHFTTGAPVDLGTPSTIDSTTTNALTAHSHTHALGDIDISSVSKAGGYGALYNWPVTQDARKISSSDEWIVPAQSDWVSMLNSIDTYEVGSQSWPLAGGKLKEIGFTHWNNPNTGATDELNFKTLGSGSRSLSDDVMMFLGLKYSTSFWISDSPVDEELFVHCPDISYSASSVTISGNNFLTFGQPIRLCNPTTAHPDGYVGTYTQNNGVVIPTIVINGVEWTMNLNETKYRNGDWITGFDGGVYTPIDNPTWAALETEAMCYYDDNELYGNGGIPVESLLHEVVSGLGMDFETGAPVDLGTPSTIDSTTTNALTAHSHTHALGDIDAKSIIVRTSIKFGALYNDYAANDARGFVSGWHLPTTAEYYTLALALGGQSIAGKKLKEIGTTYWDSPNTGTNQYGFNGRGVGTRSAGFINMKQRCLLATATPATPTVALEYNADTFYNGVGAATYGRTIRLLCDSSTDPGFVIIDGIRYKTVKIGSQVWMAENLNARRYANGDWITGYNGGVYTPISDGDWTAKTTEAMCYFDDDETNGYEIIYFTSEHNDLDGLNVGDYQHLTQAELEKLQALPTSFIDESTVIAYSIAL